MFKKNYYCLVAGLPDLFFNENKTGFSCLDFKNELQFQLNNSDLELAKIFYLKYDNQNLLNLLFEKNEPFHLLGNYKEEFLENQIIKPDEVPDYMACFLKWAKNQETLKLNLQVENKLQSLYYEYALTSKNSFLHEWFAFEQNIKNIITAFNCKQFNYSPEKHLILTSINTTVYSLLINKRLKTEFFEDELPFADQIFRISESNSGIEEREKAMDKIRWEFLDERTFFHYFTIEKILSYIIKLDLVERWMKLDIETGKTLLKKLIEDIKLSYTFPEEFSIVK